MRRRYICLGRHFSKRIVNCCKMVNVTCHKSVHTYIHQDHNQDDALKEFRNIPPELPGNYFLNSSRIFPLVCVLSYSQNRILLKITSFSQLKGLHSWSVREMIPTRLGQWFLWIKKIFPSCCQCICLTNTYKNVIVIVAKIRRHHMQRISSICSANGDGYLYRYSDALHQSFFLLYRQPDSLH